MNILILVGSKNKNLKLARKIEQALVTQNVKPHLEIMVDWNLPLYTADTEANGIPEKALSITKMVNQMDAIVFVSPEYNGGIAPVLNNSIAWISRATKDWRKAFNNKMALLASSSGSNGINNLISMRSQLAYLGMNVLGRQIRQTLKQTTDQESINETIDSFLRAIRH